MKNNLFTLTLCGWVFLGTLGHAAEASVKLSAPTVPAALQVPSTEKLLFSAKAQGVQIYQWLPKKDNPTQYEWAFKAPAADLFDAEGKKMGSHYAGPTWESTDGSKVVGALKARVDSKNPGAVPWLLLTAKTHAGNGIFTHITSIQRLETTGGKPPATAGAKPGEESRVPYAATYYFYVSE